MYAQNAPGRLPGADGSVDPALVEEAPGECSELGREGRVRVEHHVARFDPSDLGLARRHRRVAVVVGEAREPEDPLLHLVPTLRDVVAALHRIDERFDALVGRLVREVPARDPGGVVAEAIVGRLVREQRVEDERSGAQAGCEAGGDRISSLMSSLAVGVHHHRQPALERGLGAVGHRDLDLGGQLAEQADPRRAPGDVLLCVDLLLGLGEKVRPVSPSGLQVIAVGLDAIVREERIGCCVVHRCPLELEPDQLGGDRRRPLLHTLHERAI